MQSAPLDGVYKEVTFVISVKIVIIHDLCFIIYYIINYLLYLVNMNDKFGIIICNIGKLYR